MEINERKSATEYLKVFSPLFKDDDYIEITEWTNGEGWDINISTSNETKTISLHYDELYAIDYLTKYLNYYVK